VSTLPAYQNRLLASLSDTDRAWLRPHLDPVDLPLHTVLVEPGRPITHATFLEAGLGSIIVNSEEGGRVEIGLFGRDGFAGTALVLGSDRIPQQIFMQVGGHGHRIGADAFIRLTEASASLRALLLRYTHTFLVQTACTAHANASAPVQERLARWLLMYHDRQDGDELSITHDFLSMMLGVRRTTVTLTLQLLEGARLIQARRGRVIVLDREGLEGAAGDAYGPAEAEYERLIAPLRRRPDRPGPVPPRA
jgi:CRP-like cAMP-binding protein